MTITKETESYRLKRIKCISIASLTYSILVDNRSFAKNIFVPFANILTIKELLNFGETAEISKEHVTELLTLALEKQIGEVINFGF